MQSSSDNMKPQSPYLLVTLADHNFLDPARQLFSSVYRNAAWRGDCLLLAHDVAEKDLVWFRDKGILVYNCRPLADHLVGHKRYSPAVLTKFYLFTDYFRQWEKIIFLDADVIVRGPLDRLLAATGLSVVPDVLDGTLRRQFTSRYNPSLFAELKQAYDLHGLSFNTGVLAFASKIITADLFNKLYNLYQRFGALSTYGEQGIINLAFYHNWQPLPITYNFTPYDSSPRRIVRRELNPVILHFIGPDKPWLTTNPFYALWQKNLRRSKNIDFAQRRYRPIKTWTALEIDYPVLVRLKILGHPKLWPAEIMIKTDQLIGQLGRLINKISPAAYQALNKLKPCLPPKKKYQ